MTEWQQLLTAIESYYGKGSPQWVRVFTHNTTVQEFYEIIKQVPGVTIITNLDGSPRGWEYKNVLEVNTGNPVLSEIDSNIETSTKTEVSVPLNTSTETDPSTGWEVVDIEQGAKTATGAASVGGLVKLKKYVPAAALLVMTATRGGLMLTPDYWETHTTDPILANLKDVDEEKYNQIAITSEEIAQKYPGKELFYGMFKQFVDPQSGLQKGEIYVDEDAIAYMAKAMVDAGAFNFKETGTEIDTSTEIHGDTLTDYFDLPVNAGKEFSGVAGADPNNIVKVEVLQSSSFIFFVNNTGHASYPDYPYSGIICSDSEDVLIQVTTRNIDTGEETTYTERFELIRSFTHNNLTVYYFTYASYKDVFSDGDIPQTSKRFPGTAYGYQMLAWNIVWGGDPIQGGGIDGIEIQPGANILDITPNDDIPTIKQKLETQYPDMAGKKIIQQVVQPDGTVKQYEYVPVTPPSENPNFDPNVDTDPWEKPVTGDKTQGDTEIEQEPDTEEDPIVRYIIEDVTEPDDPNKENTGSGETPPIVIPTGTAKALFRVWNPTQSEIDSFGSWLWSSNFIDQLLKMFSNPMEAIIGLHKVFVTPNIGGRDNITVGYLSSGVSSNYVDGQYVTVDCGTVTLGEQYRNVFDYPPFTEVSLYLPFVGIVKLDVNDVMRGSIKVIYHVDVITGATLAEVHVTRDLSGGVIYTYTGNCAVNYPLSSGSYMGIITSAAGLIAGGVATYMTGGAALPFAVRHAVSSVSSARTSVQRSGSFSGNAGAMAIKKPYLIVTRPQTNLAVNFNKFVGIPANHTTKISACSGFISCTEVHIENCNGTDSELAELDALLKSGIII